MNIIELAKQAGMNSPDGFKLTVKHMAIFQLEKFAALVEAAARADERERTWVGLTPKEVADLVVYPMNPTADLVRAIEAKLKEKNT